MQLARPSRVLLSEPAVKPEEDPDVQLMLALQRDDNRAFDTLFRKYIGQLVGFIQGFVGSRARAEELVQDVFVQVYRNRRTYEPRARFATWLYRIATNSCLTEVRRSEYKTTVRASAQSDEDGPELDPAGMVDDSARSGEDECMAREEVAEIQLALAALPAQQRAALLLARVEGMPYDEVATSLGCSVSAVKSLIHRATVALRDRLQPPGRRRAGGED